MKTIAIIRTDFPEKFGIPRQSGLASSQEGRIVFQPEYRNPDALRGLEGFSHIWLLWGFSANMRGGRKPEELPWQPTVRPPRLGGNTQMGVFATRSPFRPNPIGLSCVRVERVEDSPELGKVIVVSGADLMDGTPIYDIKPYIKYADCHPEAVCGYVDSLDDSRLEVRFAEGVDIPDSMREKLAEVLSLDPRPSYQKDLRRTYGMSYGGYQVRFAVNDGILDVLEIKASR